MKKSLHALAAGLSIVVGASALMGVAEARDGGRFGGFTGNFGPPAAREYGGYPNRPGWNNPNYVPWVGVGPVSVDELIPENNSGSSTPNDCNYLFKKATETGDAHTWQLFNDCAHGR